MQVLKFGGTSVGSVENMNSVVDIITDGKQKIVVLSAMSGTTNSLVEISDYLHKKNKETARTLISRLHQKYVGVVTDLLKDGDNIAYANGVIESCFSLLRGFTAGEYTVVEERAILAQGEVMSTNLFCLLMKERGFNVQLLNSLEFMKIDADKAADPNFISESLNRILEETPKADYYIAQGFICMNSDDEIDNLQRGGSDYTASLIGAAVKAEEVQIWTDIDGFHNNDPRFVENTKKVESLSFDEAAELAYFGAKILHPQTVLPAKNSNTPVRLKNTMNPTDSGTLISSKSVNGDIKAVAAKDGITAIKIRSGRMLNAYGFLKNVFEIFEFFKTPIDMICTSEVAVSLTIDDDKNLDAILTELREYGEVEVDTDQAIICIVGDMISGERHSAGKVFATLDGIPIRMISYGGSVHNISLLINQGDKKQALQALSDKLL